MFLMVPSVYLLIMQFTEKPPLQIHKLPEIKSVIESARNESYETGLWWKL